MKHTIDWHKECLNNQKVWLQNKRQELLRLKAVVDSSESEMLFYHDQIVEAQRQNKDGFDSDKFLMKRKPK
jgi:hypothetical protein